MKKLRLLDGICNLDKFLPSISKAIFCVEFPHEKSGLPSELADGKVRQEKML